MRNYEELPQSVKDYADFICNISDLGLFGSMAIEDARVRLHERMCEDYGLRYEYTRVATASVYLDANKMTAERVAMCIDENLQYVKGMYEAARTDGKLEGFAAIVDELFHGKKNDN